MNDLEKAHDLAEALVVAENQLREKFLHVAQLEDGDEDIIRRDTYLEVIKQWIQPPVVSPLTGSTMPVIYEASASEARKT